jgi:hypothetical protein
MPLKFETVKVYSAAIGWKEGGLAKEDRAAASFLKLLKVLRDVLLQDLAVLQPSM